MEILPDILARGIRPSHATATLQRQRRLTRSDVDNLADLYATGINVRQLAAAFGISRDTALQHLQRRGVPSRATVRKLTAELLATATRRYLAGEPMTPLCDELGINPTTLRRELSKTGTAARFAPVEEQHAISIALELLPEGDERALALLERAARAAIRAGDRHGAVDHARHAIDAAAQTERSGAACALATRLGRYADKVEQNSGWSIGRLADPCRETLDPTGAEAVQLLAWEIEHAEFLDPNNPGIAIDSPARRQLQELAGRLEPGERPTTYLHPSAAAVLADYRRGRRSLALRLGFEGPGLYREAALEVRKQIERIDRNGLVSLAVFMRGSLGRLHLVLGELNIAAELQAEGEELMPRVEPGSNAAGHFEVLAKARSWFVEDDPAPICPSVEEIERAATREDSRWLSGNMRIVRAFCLTALGDHVAGMIEVSKNLVVIERAHIGALNSVIAIHSAVQALWIADRAEHVPMLERHLHAKVLEPDFCRLDTDGRWDAAVLCALAGRHDEARAWFQQAHDRLNAQGAIMLLPYVCCDEALMEARLGSAGDRANGRRRLDNAHEWVERIGLPKLLPRIHGVAAQLSD